MKEIVLIVSLLGINTASSQFSLDFESLIDQNIAANTDKIIAYIDKNPVTNGINTSEYAVRVTELKGTPYWGSGIADNFQNTISFEDGRYFSVDFFSPKSEGMITLKLGKDIEKDFIYSGKANTWRQAIFNFSKMKKSISSSKIEIFFDVRDYKNVKKTSSQNRSEEEYWFDNITQSKRRIRKKRK